MLIYLLFDLQDNRIYAEVVKLADALDSKSSIGNNVRVQVPPSAPKNEDGFSPSLFFGLNGWRLNQESGLLVWGKTRIL